MSTEYVTDGLREYVARREREYRINGDQTEFQGLGKLYRIQIRLTFIPPDTVEFVNARIDGML